MRWLAVMALAAAFSSGTSQVTIAPVPYHKIAGIGLDRDWLVVAEDPDGAPCPVVKLIRLPSRAQRTLTLPNGPSCKLGFHFLSSRPIANALQTAVWIVGTRHSAAAIVFKPGHVETALLTESGTTPARGPFLGPVVGTNWLTLFGAVSRQPDGKWIGGAISGNNRELWADDGTPLPTGLDDQEHAVSIGADGSIAMWQAHGARYGRVRDADAQWAALDAGRVYVLRRHAPRLDIRLLSGKLVRSWPVERDALSGLDVAGTTAVYAAGRDVRELNLTTGKDRVVATAPARVIDAQIEAHWLVYATAAKVVAIPR